MEEEEDMISEGPGELERTTDCESSMIQLRDEFRKAEKELLERVERKKTLSARMSGRWRRRGERGGFEAHPRRDEDCLRDETR